jgi:uncharacterized protein YeaO (DUF488 family)
MANNTFPLTHAENILRWQAGTDVVNGIVIGDVNSPYEFWTEGKTPARIASNWFKNDEEAIAWFKENYPREFKQGCEMRVFE